MPKPTITISKERLQELENIEANISSIVQRSVQDYIQNEEMKRALKRLKKIPKPSEPEGKQE